MESLHPTVWRTCRALSNNKRLLLLWKLLQVGESSVSQLGDAVGLSESAASTCLRALNTRGLILAERRKKYVFYRPEANPEVEHADRFLKMMRACYDGFMPLDLVAYHMTAFTHPRRIDIVRALNEGPCDEVQLSIQTRISPQALYRHLRKLTARGYVEKVHETLSLVPQENQLARELLAIALGL
ncbi:ArsR family transcriptional regulator [Pontiellaceae bacterium B12227]|nr:ArsR family transcriptional regulator [Pontiellaceae bacterium B12227]